MRTPAMIAACWFALAASAALAGEDTSRTYAKKSCTERNASPDDCIVQNGPPPPRFVGPAVVPTVPAPAPTKPAPGGSSSGPVTILGGGSQSER